MGKRSSLSVTALRPNLHSSVLRPLSPWFPLHEKESLKHPSNTPAFWGCYPKTDFHVVSLRTLRRLTQWECLVGEGRWGSGKGVIAFQQPQALQDWRRYAILRLTLQKRKSICPQPTEFQSISSGKGVRGIIAASCIRHLASTGKTGGK